MCPHSTSNPKQTHKNHRAVNHKGVVSIIQQQLSRYCCCRDKTTRTLPRGAPDSHRGAQSVPTLRKQQKPPDRMSEFNTFPLLLSFLFIYEFFCNINCLWKLFWVVLKKQDLTQLLSVYINRQQTPTRLKQSHHSYSPSASSRYRLQESILFSHHSSDSLLQCWSCLVFGTHLLRRGAWGCWSEGSSEQILPLWSWWRLWAEETKHQSQNTEVWEFVVQQITTVRTSHRQAAALWQSEGC